MDLLRLLREIGQEIDLACERYLASLGLILYGKPDAPAAPDYRGAATTEGNAAIQTALVNALIGQPTQITPFGSLTRSQTGTTTIPGVGDRPAFDMPTYSMTTELSPEQQALYEKRTQAQTGALTNAMGLLGEPFSLEGLPEDYMGEAADAYYGRAASYFEPEFERARERTETDLINRGFSLGNEGYTRALDDLSRREAQVRENARREAITEGARLGLTERQQAVAERLAGRNQPLAEFSALTTEAAPVMPQFPQYAGGTATPPNILGATQAQGQAATDIYNADVGTYNAMLGGLGGLGTAYLLGSGMAGGLLF